ncbi:hypothetical protein [Amycolatopsis rifamycinica]|nr:hypothetical protein [Amycolatopsis rifamycinica]
MRGEQGLEVDQRRDRGGIGAATALALATQGANVALVARRKDRPDAGQW